MKKLFILFLFFFTVPAICMEQVRTFNKVMQERLKAAQESNNVRLQARILLRLARRHERRREWDKAKEYLNTLIVLDYNGVEKQRGKLLLAHIESQQSPVRPEALEGSNNLKN